ncbi:MAG: sigma 54-interacting transcriptional regulator [Proteobacteria bacterium]|nr:sigma 54-interacting transcriptional regulator [Pseudomonadota bacterium]
MKLAITTENKPGMTDEVLSVLKAHGAHLRKVEVTDDKIFLETQGLEKHVQGTVASLIMKISGVKWVNQIEVLPGVERHNMLNSLMNSLPDPMFAINRLGQISYANKSANALFQSAANDGKMPDKMKDIFVNDDWQEKANAAGLTNIPVSIMTISGKMLLEVQSIKGADHKASGAVLVFRRPEKVTISSYVMQGDEFGGFESMIHHSAGMKNVIQRAKSLADVDASLMLVGEMGTGKSLLAHACHKFSIRKNALFISIGCQELSHEEQQGILFGTRDKKGVLELNQNGSIYLSHVDQLSHYVQRKLLNYLKQDHNDGKARIIASTLTDLSNKNDQQKLIPELLYALDVLKLKIPSLRERQDDIEPLTAYFFDRYRDQLGKADLKLSFAALNKIKQYYWPGNIKQLQHVICQSTLVVSGDVVQADDVNIEAPVNLEPELEGMTLSEAVGEFEKHFLQHWYHKYPSSRKLAAQLGVSHTTIAQKINKYHLSKK